MASDWMRQLPGGKPISALGFGCSSLWAKSDFPEDRADAMLEAAAREGINHFDTSPSYGNGVGETRLGRFLAGYDPAGLVVSTKVGSNLIDGRIVRGFDPALMRRSFEDSLRRLGRDHVDILYLHGPSIADLGPETMAFFDALKAEGRIGWSGVNSFDAATLDHVATTPIDAVMLQYNVIDQAATPQIGRLAGAGKIVISGTALGRAKYRLSTFVPRDRAGLWYLLRMLRDDPAFPLRARRLARDLTATGKPATDTAIQFVAGHPLILSNLFGTSRIAHLVANARAGHGALPRDAWERLAG